MSIKITDVNKDGCTLVVKARAIKLSYEEVGDVMEALRAIKSAAVSCGWVAPSSSSTQVRSQGNPHGRRYIYPDDVVPPVSDFLEWRSADITPIRRRARELDEETIQKIIEFEEKYKNRINILRIMRNELEIRHRARPRPTV